MKSIFKIASNQSGSVMVMGLIMVTMTVAMVGTITFVADKENMQRRVTRDRDKIDEIYTNVTGVLADSRFCNAFFANGFATTAGSVPFTNATISGGGSYRPRARVIQQEMRDKFRVMDYQVDSILLSNQRVVPNQGIAAESIKLFDVSVNISKISPTKTIFKNVRLGRDGINASQINDHITVAISERTGACEVHKTAVNTSSALTAKSVKDACASLGGTLDGTTFRCRLEKLKLMQPAVSNDVYNPNDKELVSNNFSDALCEFEKNILKKNRTAGYLPTVAKTSADYRTRNWTNFCKKPQWGGCFAGSTYYLQGETRSLPPATMKANALGGFINKKIGETLTRRVSRLYTVPKEFNVDKTLSVAKALGFIPASYGNSNHKGGILMGSVGGLGQTSGMNFSIDSGLTIGQTMGLAIIGGMALVTIVLALLARCDKGRVFITQVCADGKFEDQSFSYQTQKRKRLFSCKWVQRGVAQSPTDQIIVSKGVKTVPLQPGVNETVSAAELASEAALQQEDINNINKATKLVDLIEVDNEPGEYDTTDSVPAAVLKAYLEKEKKLIESTKQLITDTQNKIISLKAESEITAAEISALQRTIDSLLAELKYYARFQGNIAGTDKSSLASMVTSMESMGNEIRTVMPTPVAVTSL